VGGEGGDRDVPQAHARLRVAADREAAVGELEVIRADLQQVGGDRPGLFHDLPGRFGYRRAAEDQRS
jgi:hypothetical protein